MCQVRQHSWGSAEISVKVNCITGVTSDVKETSVISGGKDAAGETQ